MRRHGNQFDRYLAEIVTLTSSTSKLPERYRGLDVRFMMVQFGTRPLYGLTCGSACSKESAPFKQVVFALKDFAFWAVNGCRGDDGRHLKATRYYITKP
jgi:hypothetical protein